MATDGSGMVQKQNVQKMDSKDVKNDIKDFVQSGSNNVTNNAVKAVLLGFIVGAFFFFLGKDFDFTKPYGVAQGIVSGVIVTGLLFLKYNSQK